jgi:hypothetical protein
MSISEIPPRDKKMVVDLIESLIGQHGFKKNDFTQPEPSDMGTPNIGWWLKLRNFPSYYFFFRQTQKGLYIKYLPSPDSIKEKELSVNVFHGKNAEAVRSQAIRWLETIEEGITEDRRFKSFSHPSDENEFISFEEVSILEDQTSSTPEDDIELTPDEISNIRAFLKEFNELVQNSETLPTETKEEIANAKNEAEKLLENKPTRKVIKWIGKILDGVTVKLITDKAFRGEISEYITKSFEQVTEMVKGWLQ